MSEDLVTEVYYESRTIEWGLGLDWAVFYVPANTV